MAQARVDPRRLAAARTTRLGAAEVVEAIYRGGAPALQHFVGRPAVWIVVDHEAGQARLAPYPLPLGYPVHGRVESAALTEFEAIQRIAKLGDDA